MYMKGQNGKWRMFMYSTWIAYTLFITATVYRACGTWIRIRILDTERILNWRGAGLIHTAASVVYCVIDADV